MQEGLSLASVLACRFVVLPARAVVDPRLSLLDLRTLARVIALGAAYTPGGALLSTTAAARAWGCHPATLRACLRRLEAWGYLRRSRAGRYTRFFAADFPPLDDEAEAERGPWEEPMRPLRSPLQKVRVAST